VTILPVSAKWSAIDTKKAKSLGNRVFITRVYRPLSTTKQQRHGKTQAEAVRALLKLK